MRWDKRVVEFCAMLGGGDCPGNSKKVFTQMCFCQASIHMNKFEGEKNLRRDEYESSLGMCMRQK